MLTPGDAYVIAGSLPLYTHPLVFGRHTSFKRLSTREAVTCVVLAVVRSRDNVGGTNDVLVYASDGNIGWTRESLLRRMSSSNLLLRTDEGAKDAAAVVR